VVGEGDLNTHAGSVGNSHSHCKTLYTRYSFRNCQAYLLIDVKRRYPWLLWIYITDGRHTLRISRALIFM
jgi:hypothetical protein